FCAVAGAVRSRCALRFLRGGSLLSISLVLLGFAFPDHVVTACHGADGFLGLARDVLNDDLDAFFRTSVLLVSHAYLSAESAGSVVAHFLSLGALAGVHRESSRAVVGFLSTPWTKHGDSSVSSQCDLSLNSVGLLRNSMGKRSISSNSESSSTVSR